MSVTGSRSGVKKISKRRLLGASHDVHKNTKQRIGFAPSIADYVDHRSGKSKKRGRRASNLFFADWLSHARKYGIVGIEMYAKRS